LGSANPLSDRKLLEELQEEEVRKSGYDGGSPGTHVFSDGEMLLPDVRAIRDPVILSIITTYARF
jgi:hypothetical protein